MRTHKGIDAPHVPVIPVSVIETITHGWGAGFKLYAVVSRDNSQVLRAMAWVRVSVRVSVSASVSVSVRVRASEGDLRSCVYTTPPARMCW
jgi:hypothetical protein